MYFSGDRLLSIFNGISDRTFMAIGKSVDGLRWNIALKVYNKNNCTAFG
jgi:hypothetical protein